MLFGFRRTDKYCEEIIGRFEKFFILENSEDVMTETNLNESSINK